MNKYFCSIVTLAALTVASSALADSYYCSNTNQYVNTGDTIDQVLKACGTPSNTNTRTITQTRYKKTGEKIIWVYPNRGISVVFQGKRVVAVNSGGNQFATYTKLCNHSYYVTVGMSNYRVQQICGTPVRIINTEKEKKKIVETTWQYQTNSSVPAETLIFRNGKLYSVGS